MNENQVFETALEIAVGAHKGATDQSGMPYILHPIAVAAKLDTLMNDMDQTLAVLLGLA